MWNPGSSHILQGPLRRLRTSCSSHSAKRSEPFSNARSNIKRSKRIDIAYRFPFNHFEKRIFNIQHIPRDEQIADILAKSASNNRSIVHTLRLFPLPVKPAQTILSTMRGISNHQTYWSSSSFSIALSSFPRPNPEFVRAFRQIAHFPVQLRRHVSSISNRFIKSINSSSIINHSIRSITWFSLLRRAITSFSADISDL